MTKEEIIEVLKNNYSRDLRKQMVASILNSEKDSNEEGIKSSYKLMNQIFSYVLGELNWNIAQSTNDWDYTPLSVINESFPKIETTKWFQEQQLHVEKSIKLEGNFK